MRTLLLASAALLALTAAPGFAQTAEDTMVVPSQHEPKSAAASNNNAADTRSTIAPQLPAPAVGPDATAAQLLAAAQQALQNRRSGEAQEALERAETRLLDRSTRPSAAGEPDARPAIQKISQARDAIGRKDWAAASQAIEAAMHMPRVAGGNEMPMPPDAPPNPM